MGFKVSRAKKSNNTLIIAGMVAMGTVTLGSLSYLAYSSAFAAKPNDPKTLCPAGGPLGHTVLVVDKSDPMTFTQRKDFDILYRETIMTLVPKGHLLSVYALADNFKSTAEPLLERCNPGDGSDARELDGNPLQLKKEFEQRYATPFLELRDELVTDKPGKASPILEMIQLASITGFGKHSVNGEKKMIIVSDMIHFTPELDMYKQIPRYEFFVETAYGRKKIASLDGVKVEFRLLLNTPNVQNENLLTFWQKHITQSGGKLVRSQPVKG